MNKFCTLLSLGAIALTSIANADSSCDKTITAALKGSKADLTLVIQDKEDVHNACDYVVRRVEYVDALKTLMVELQTQPCFIDRFGKQSAKIQWTLPMALRAGSKIQLLLNHEKAGSITLKAGEASFEFDSEEKCEGRKS
jgi:hypothetical protein